MESALFRWFLGVVSAIILALVGVVWSMRKGELDRRDLHLISELKALEAKLSQRLDRLEIDMKTLRDERHANTESISVISGRCTLIEDDMNKLQSQRYIAEQLRDEIRSLRDKI